MSIEQMMQVVDVDEMSATIERLTADRNELRNALKDISEIKNNAFGGDWDEIDTARDIAKAALKQSKP